MLSLKKLSLLGLSCFFADAFNHSAQAQNSITILEKDEHGQCTQIILSTLQNGIYVDRIYPLYAYQDKLDGYTLKTNIAYGSTSYNVYITPDKKYHPKNTTFSFFNMSSPLASQASNIFERNASTFGRREAIIDECHLPDNRCLYDPLFINNSTQKNALTFDVYQKYTKDIPLFIRNLANEETCPSSPQAPFQQTKEVKEYNKGVKLEQKRYKPYAPYGSNHPNRNFGSGVS